MSLLGQSVVWVTAVLAVGAGLVIRWRVLKSTGRVGPSLSDDDVRAIEDSGRLTKDDDPLDLDEVRKAEDRFWSESWDEPDDY